MSRSQSQRITDVLLVACIALVGGCREEVPCGVPIVGPAVWNVGFVGFRPACAKQETSTRFGVKCGDIYSYIHDDVAVCQEGATGAVAFELAGSNVERLVGSMSGGGLRLQLNIKGGSARIPSGANVESVFYESNGEKAARLAVESPVKQLKVFGDKLDSLTGDGLLAVRKLDVSTPLAHFGGKTPMLQELTMRYVAEPGTGNRALLSQMHMGLERLDLTGSCFSKAELVPVLASVAPKGRALISNRQVSTWDVRTDAVVGQSRHRAKCKGVDTRGSSELPTLIERHTTPE